MCVHFANAEFEDKRMEGGKCDVEGMADGLLTEIKNLLKNNWQSK